MISGRCRRLQESRGAEAFAAFASVIKTAMRQGKDVVEWLSALFRGIDPKAPDVTEEWSACALHSSFGGSVAAAE